MYMTTHRAIVLTVNFLSVQKTFNILSRQSLTFLFHSGEFDSINSVSCFQLVRQEFDHFLKSKCVAP